MLNGKFANVGTERIGHQTGALIAVRFSDGRSFNTSFPVFVLNSRLGFELLLTTVSQFVCREPRDYRTAQRLKNRNAVDISLFQKFCPFL